MCGQSLWFKAKLIAVVVTLNYFSPELLHPWNEGSHSHRQSQTLGRVEYAALLYRTNYSGSQRTAIFGSSAVGCLHPSSRRGQGHETLL